MTLTKSNCSPYWMLTTTESLTFQSRELEHKITRSILMKCLRDAIPDFMQHRLESVAYEVSRT